MSKMLLAIFLVYKCDGQIVRRSKAVGLENLPVRNKFRISRKLTLNMHGSTQDSTPAQSTNPYASSSYAPKSYQRYGIWTGRRLRVRDLTILGWAITALLVAGLLIATFLIYLNFRIPIFPRIAAVIIATPIALTAYGIFIGLNAIMTTLGMPLARPGYISTESVEPPISSDEYPLSPALLYEKVDAVYRTSRACRLLSTPWVIGSMICGMYYTDRVMGVAGGDFQDILTIATIGIIGFGPPLVIYFLLLHHVMRQHKMFCPRCNSSILQSSQLYLTASGNCKDCGFHFASEQNHIA